jgi:hypothetical protein
MMSFAFISLANAQDSHVEAHCHLWGHGYNQSMDRYKDGNAPIDVEVSKGYWRDGYAWCNAYVLKSGSNIKTAVVVHGTVTWWGGHASAWGEAVVGADPLTSVGLPYGISMEQMNLSHTDYTIVVIDLNTSVVLDSYEASITNGSFTATPNWAASWFVLANSSTHVSVQLPALNISTPVPDGDLAEVLSMANATSYTDDMTSNASVVSMPMPPIPTEEVGGEWAPMDSLSLASTITVAPYIGLASTIALATAATAVYVTRVRRRKEKP